MIFWSKTKTEKKTPFLVIGLALFIASFLFIPSMALLEENDALTDAEKDKIITDTTSQIEEKQKISE